MKLVLTAMVAALAVSSANAATPSQARQYAHNLATFEGWSDAEFQALDQIIMPESGWDSCAVNPARRICDYRGTSSCGIPQATPCPYLWLGRLDRTWKAQIRWLFDYIRRRYGSPSAALQFRRANKWY